MIFNKEEFCGNLNSIVELARKSNIPIFFTSIQMLSKRFESSANIYTLSKLGFDRLFEQFTTENMDFTIKPKQDEIVINKHTASIFIDTGFERMLRNAGIITIVFTGIATIPNFQLLNFLTDLINIIWKFQVMFFFDLMYVFDKFRALFLSEIFNFKFFFFFGPGTHQRKAQIHSNPLTDWSFGSCV